MKIKLSKNLIILSSIIVLTTLFLATKVSACRKPCQSYYGICPPTIKNIQFTLIKSVKKQGTSEYTNKVIVEPGEIVEFLIQAENVGDVKTDEMKIVDYLPVEFELIEGTTLLEFGNFRVGDIVEMEIKAKVKEDLEKDICLVNTTELMYQDNPTNSATAVVCVEQTIEPTPIERTPIEPTPTITPQPEPEPTPQISKQPEQVVEPTPTITEQPEQAEEPVEQISPGQVKAERITEEEEVTVLPATATINWANLVTAFTAIGVGIYLSRQINLSK